MLLHRVLPVMLALPSTVCKPPPKLDELEAVLLSRVLLISVSPPSKMKMPPPV